MAMIQTVPGLPQSRNFRVHGAGEAPPRHDVGKAISGRNGGQRRAAHRLAISSLTCPRAPALQGPACRRGTCTPPSVPPSSPALLPEGAKGVCGEAAADREARAVRSPPIPAFPREGGRSDAVRVCVANVSARPCATAFMIRFDRVIVTSAGSITHSADGPCSRGGRAATEADPGTHAGRTVRDALLTYIKLSLTKLT